MTAKTEAPINPDTIFAPILRGVMRSHSFLGIISNPENSIDIVSTKGNLNIEDAKPEPLETSKENFIHFIQNNIICDLVEYHLDSVEMLYQACELIENESEKKTKFKKKFSYIRRKTHKEIFTVFEHLNHIRNAITHNHSFVDQDKIELKLPDVSLSHTRTDASGNTTIIGEYSLSDFPKVYMEKGDQMRPSVSTKTITLNKGDEIKFTNEQLYHFIQATIIDAKSSKKHFINYLMKHPNVRK